MNNGRTFKYVDKDRILPWIDRKLSELSLSNGSESYGRLEQLREIKDNIEYGVFDWQPSE